MPADRVRYRFIFIHPEPGACGYSIRSNKTGGLMGCITYEPRWKRWVASFSEKFIWSDDCLADVGRFLQTLDGTAPRKGD